MIRDFEYTYRDRELAMAAKLLDSDIRRILVEIVREARPWRYSRSGLKRAALPRVGVSVKGARLSRAINKLVADGMLVEEHRQRAFGLKMRLALPNVEEHALPEVPARNTRMVHSATQRERTPFRGRVTTL